MIHGYIFTIYWTLHPVHEIHFDISAIMLNSFDDYVVANLYVLCAVPELR